MGLSGNFKETSFADLLQFYSLSRQTVAVSIRLASPDRVDGTFYFSDGDLVGARLADAEGREAVRRALRLREGIFTVEIGSHPPVRGARETLRSVVMEEVVRLDEENRALAGDTPPATKHTGAVASGAAWFSAPDAPPPPSAAPAPPGGQGAAQGPPPVPANGPQPAAAAPPPARPPVAARPAPRTPAAAPQSTPGKVAARTGAAAPARATPGTGEVARRTPRPAFAPPSRGAGKTIAIAAGVAVVVAAGAWLVLSDRAPAEVRRTATSTRGVIDDRITLGMVASFTGSNKERGRAMKVGWDVAIAEVNEARGIHGRKLRLLTLDDGYDPARTGSAMKDIVETQGAFAIVGNVGTATAAVAAPYAAERDAVFFGALSGADLLRKTPPARHVFNFRAGLAAEGAAAVRYLVDVRRVDPRRIATLEQEDDFGASGRRGAVKQLASYGVAEGGVLKLGYPRNTADVREAIAELKERAAGVDAVVMVATYKPAATFVRKAKDAGLHLFFTTVSADSNGLAEELVLSGKRYTEDVLLTQVVPVPTSPASTLIRYRQALEKHAPGEKPGSTSLEAWIGAQIFVEALRRAGRDLNSAKLVSALESIRELDLGIGASISFGPEDHQGCEVVWGWLLQPDGTYRQVNLE